MACAQTRTLAEAVTTFSSTEMVVGWLEVELQKEITD
jgi:hypothetical protein